MACNVAKRVLLEVVGWWWEASTSEKLSPGCPRTVSVRERLTQLVFSCSFTELYIQVINVPTDRMMFSYICLIDPGRALD